jgi:hypothetical protein
MREANQTAVAASARELSGHELAAVVGGIEQVLNIGSHNGGAGAGKVTFNPFQITRK